MNKMFNKISEYFTTKDISGYPEFLTKTHSRDLGYTINVASSAVFYDIAAVPRSINWKAF